MGSFFNFIFSPVGIIAYGKIIGNIYHRTNRTIQGKIMGRQNDKKTTEKRRTLFEKRPVSLTGFRAVSWKFCTPKSFYYFLILYFPIIVGNPGQV